MAAGSNRTGVGVRDHRWGVILAGGDGKRLLRIRLSKRTCNFGGFSGALG